jgi:heptosyltransferase-2
LTVSPEKILIIRLSAIGDILLATPLLRALRARFPTARLDFVVKSQFAEVLRYHPAIDHLYELNPNGGWPELRALARRLRQVRYDVIFDIHKNFRSRYLAAAAKPRRILRHRKHALRRWLLVNTKINFMNDVPPIYQRYLAAAKPLGLSASPAGGRWLELFWSDREEREAEQALTAQNWQPHLPLIGLAPGAGYFTKRWPPEYFAELAARLIVSKTKWSFWWRLAGFRTGSEHDEAFGICDGATAYPWGLHQFNRRAFVVGFGRRP